MEHMLNGVSIEASCKVYQLQVGTIMGINKLRGISEHLWKADKSALGAINRPLQMAGLICQFA